jgi:serine/threonine protein kinase
MDYLSEYNAIITGEARRVQRYFTEMTADAFNKAYAIVGRAGSGTEGFVDKCIDAKTGKVCAVKTLSPPNDTGESDTEHIQCFLTAYLEDNRRELDLQIPTLYQICRIKQRGDSADVWKVVMEYVDGTLEDLSKLTNAQLNISPDLFWKLAGDLSDTLFRIRELGISYRDLHSRNVMLSTDPHTGRMAIRLVDLGRSCVPARTSSIVEVYTAFQKSNPLFPTPEHLLCTLEGPRSYVTEFWNRRLLSLLLEFSLHVQFSGHKAPFATMSGTAKVGPVELRPLWDALVTDSAGKVADHAPSLRAICRQIHIESRKQH